MERYFKWAQRGIIALAVVCISASVFYLKESGKKPVCPDDFATFEESVVAFDEWLVTYLEMNPQASMPEMVAARKQFYVENNCAAALERFKDGEMVSDTIQVP